MKVLWFSPHAQVAGGTLPIVEAAACLSQDVEIVVVVPRSGGLQDRLGQLGVRVIVVNSRGWATADRYWGGPVLRLGRNALSLPRMTQVLRKEVPDLVLTNSIFSPLAAV